MYSCVYVNMYVHINACMYVFIVCTYISMCEYMYVCMYVCMHMCMYVCTH